MTVIVRMPHYLGVIRMSTEITNNDKRHDIERLLTA